MANKELALFESDPGPQPGQDARSSADEIFHELPPEALPGLAVKIFHEELPDPNDPFGQIREVEEPNIFCNLSWNRPGVDPIVVALFNRNRVNPRILETGNNYYISSPEGATGKFKVRFVGNV